MYRDRRPDPYLWVRLTVSGDGTVDSAAIYKSRGSSERINECFLAEVRALRLHETPGGETLSFERRVRQGLARPK